MRREREESTLSRNAKFALALVLGYAVITVVMGLAFSRYPDAFDVRSLIRPLIGDEEHTYRPRTIPALMPTAPVDYALTEADGNDGTWAGDMLEPTYDPLTWDVREIFDSPLFQLDSDEALRGPAVHAVVPADEVVTIFNSKEVTRATGDALHFADRCIVERGGRIIGSYVPKVKAVAFVYRAGSSSDDPYACPSGVVSVISTPCLERWRDGKACVPARAP